MDDKAANRWNRLNEAFAYLTRHIESKRNRYELTELDLVLVSNFKGGNASITEPLGQLRAKLRIYGERLRELGEKYEGRSLSSLNDSELSDVQAAAHAFILLPLIADTAIRGFKSSYASGLLAGYFPDLLPVLDRRIVDALNRRTPLEPRVRWTGNQVINIENHYPSVIRKLHALLCSGQSRSLRELDKELFSSAFVSD